MSESESEFEQQCHDSETLLLVAIVAYWALLKNKRVLSSLKRMKPLTNLHLRRASLTLLCPQLLFSHTEMIITCLALRDLQQVVLLDAKDARFPNNIMVNAVMHLMNALVEVQV